MGTFRKVKWCYFTIILYVVEGSEKMLAFCVVAIFRETFRME